MNDVCIALFKKEQEEKKYQYYVAECARITTENTAKIAAMIGGKEAECKYINASLQDILNPKPIDRRTGEEVIDHICNELKKIGCEVT